jgi:predicted Fe-Mo cluster-binding NifX family protein
MKIALPVNSLGEIDGHFGHCEYYDVFTITDQHEISDTERIQSESGCGCKSNIAVTLAQKGVTTMLAGGIGQGAINVLNHAGIDVIRGCSGNAKNNVLLFLTGKIQDGGSSCEHHHGEGHNCNH